MGLQLRVKHALGTTMVDVPARPAEQAVVIGRSAQADIKIPSTSVGPTHALIYVQDGQWVIQDGGSPTGTFVNGQQIDADFLSFGDVITLGSDRGAPRLEVDPLGIGRRAAAGAAAAPQQPPAALASASGHEQPQVAPQEDAEQSPWPAAAAWPPASSAVDPRQPGYYSASQRQKPKNNMLVIFGVVAAVVVGAGIIGAIRIFTTEEPPAPPKPQVVQRDDSIFGFGMGGGGGGETQPRKATPTPVIPDDPSPTPRATPKTAWKPGPTTVTPAPNRGEGDPDEPATKPKSLDPNEQEPAWQRVDDIHDRVLSDPAMAIRIYEEYRRDNPKSSLIAKLNAYVDEAADLLWWIRVKELWEAREAHKQQIEDLNSIISESTDAEFKKGKIEARQSHEERRDRLTGDIEEMGYKFKEPPQPSNGEQLAKLRAARSDKFYQMWKKTIVARCARDGRKPWESPR